MAIGNPFGLGGTVTAGIISARNRDINLTRYDDFIQTDASINQGNSGGPLFNLKGEVIGINTAILGQGGSIGIGFAIPANAASNVINQLIEFGETKRGWLGVRIQEVTKEIAEVEKLKKPQGALVASVGENSPADKAGVKAGDIILEFDGKKIDTMRKLPKVVANTEVGKSVQLKIWRNKKSITKKLTLGRLESSEEFKEKKIKTVKKKEKVIKSLKISVREVNDNDISSRNLNKNIKGVVITNIENKSPLASVLSVNDIIIEVQKNPVKNSSDLKNIVDGIFKKGEKTLLITVIDKNNRRRYLGVKIN
jgi:serine protease Do